MIGERRIDDKLNRLRTKKCFFFNSLDLLIVEQAINILAHVTVVFSMYVETIANAIP